MDIRGAIKSQYYAALEMLKQAIVACPAPRWDDPQARKKFVERWGEMRQGQATSG